MGLFSRTVTTAAPAATSDIEASLAPVNVTSSLYNIYGVAGITASRVEFMSVPTCARARNIISSSVASIPLKVRTRADGARVESPPKVINQPDPRVPGFATYAWLAEDLLLYGYGYMRILEIYAVIFDLCSLRVCFDCDASWISTLCASNAIRVCINLKNAHIPVAI